MNVDLVDFPLDSSTRVTCASMLFSCLGWQIRHVRRNRQASSCCNGSAVRRDEGLLDQSVFFLAPSAVDPATLSLPASAAIAVNIKDHLKCPLRRIHCARCKPATVTTCSLPSLQQAGRVRRRKGMFLLGLSNGKVVTSGPLPIEPTTTL